VFISIACLGIVIGIRGYAANAVFGVSLIQSKSYLRVRKERCFFKKNYVGSEALSTSIKERKTPRAEAPCVLLSSSKE